MRMAVFVIGSVLGAYFVARAVAEPFVIDMGDPATYASDWGGPSLLGVLAVHCGPGLLALGVAFALLRRRSGRTVRQPAGGDARPGETAPVLLPGGQRSRLQRRPAISGRSAGWVRALEGVDRR